MFHLSLSQMLFTNEFIQLSSQHYYIHFVDEMRKWHREVKQLV